MSTSYSTNYLFIEPAVNDPTTTNQWGDLLNLDMVLIDSALGGSLTMSVAGNSAVVLTSIQGQPDQARNYSFTFTGAISGTVAVLWPQGLNRNFRVTNNTTGGGTLVIGANNGSGAAAGTTYPVPRGSTSLLSSDGTNVGATFNDGFLPLTGGTLQGNPATALALNVATVNNRSLRFQTNFNDRWAWVVNNAAEGGANSGSNMFLQNYADNGALIGNVLGFNRATGVSTFTQIPLMPTATPGSGNTQGANAQYVDTAIVTYNNFANNTFFPIAGGAITGNTTLGDGANSIALALTGSSGTNRNLEWLTGNNLRWSLTTNSTAEAGGNVGSNLVLQRFANDGSFISGVYTVTRSTGVMAFGISPTVPTPATDDDSLTVVNSAWVNNVLQALPVARGLDSIINPTGTNAFVLAARIVLGVPTGGATYLVSGSAGWSFSSTGGGTGLKVRVDGVDLNIGVINGSGTLVAGSTVQAVQLLAAGAHNVDLLWLGSNANVTLQWGTISAIPVS